MAKDIRATGDEMAPFLAQYAVPRHKAAQLPGAYCAERHVWVVPAAGGSLPMVSAAADDILEVHTKTMQRVELEDHLEAAAPASEEVRGAALSALLEIATKTQMDAEREDELKRH